MGVTTTPINGFTLPDDNEALRMVYSHLRNHANQLEVALRSRGLTTSDVTGYLDLLGRFNAIEAQVAKVVLDPVIVTQGTPGATYTAGTTPIVHAAYTVNPATLFGAGVGALVFVDARLLVDASVSTSVRADFAVEDDTTGANLVMDSQSWTGQRQTLKSTYSDIIAAGATRAYRTRLDTISGGNLVSYSDGTINRMRLTVLPIAQ